MKKVIKKIKIKNLLPFIAILVLGFLLRLVWDPHQIIWSYDQARDSFFMREMIKNKDLILLGPQAEQYGLFHGPLYYYIFAPFYALSKGETLLPLVVMTILNLTGGVALALLSFKITKSKLGALFTFFIFSTSYALVEYSRWLSNVSITIPFICWAYYLLYEILEKRINKFSFFLLGFFLGLAVQGEIFFLSLIATFLIVLIVERKKFKDILFYLGGSVLGMAPILIAQIKFKFLGARIFSDLFTKGFSSTASTSFDSLVGYLNHLGMTFYQTIGGLSPSMGLFFLFFILAFVYKKISKKWLLTIFLSHMFLFTFEYVDTFFVNLGLSLLLIVLTGTFFYHLYNSNKLLFLGAALLLIVSQAGVYKSYLIGRKPFGEYRFIQTTSTLKDLDEMADVMYKKSGGEEFTFTSIGTPFGVRTVWASVFELYSKKHNVPLPKWLEYYAEGYPGDDILTPVKKPDNTHILVLEENVESLVPKPIIVRELGNQDNNTKEIEEIDMYGANIQIRKPIIR